MHTESVLPNDGGIYTRISRIANPPPDPPQTLKALGGFLFPSGYIDVAIDR